MMINQIQHYWCGISSNYMLVVKPKNPKALIFSDIASFKNFAVNIVKAMNKYDTSEEE